MSQFLFCLNAENFIEFGFSIESDQLGTHHRFTNWNIAVALSEVLALTPGHIQVTEIRSIVGGLRVTGYILLESLDGVDLNHLENKVNELSVVKSATQIKLGKSLQANLQLKNRPTTLVVDRVGSVSSVKGFSSSGSLSSPRRPLHHSFGSDDQEGDGCMLCRTVCLLE